MLDQRDEHGYARAPDGRIIHVSREDIRDIMARATMYEAACICLPEQAEKFNRILPKLRSYSTADIDDIVWYLQSRRDVTRYPLNDIIEKLTTHMGELKEEMDMIRRQNAIRSEISIESRNSTIDRRWIRITEETAGHSEVVTRQA